MDRIDILLVEQFGEGVPALVLLVVPGQHPVLLVLEGLPAWLHRLALRVELIRLAFLSRPLLVHALPVHLLTFVSGPVEVVLALPHPQRMVLLSLKEQSSICLEISAVLFLKEGRQLHL